MHVEVGRIMSNLYGSNRSQGRKRLPLGTSVSNAASSTPQSHTHSIMAAALQDHLSKQYSLSLAPPISSRKLGPNPARKNKRCSKCGDSAGGDISKKGKAIEYVLDEAPPPLSLAQRLGLVDAPPRLLDEQRWTDVKSKSNTRHDSTLPCPICQEHFGLTTQVLLSCSHVFHLACLTAFEKFSQKKCCPLCRTENYQKRVVYEGAQHWRHRAATIIQSQWRGYVVRRWYQHYREQVPPTHPQLRAKHFEKKLSTLTQQMVRSCEQSGNQAQYLLDQSDANIITAREAMKLCDLELRGDAGPSSQDWEDVRGKAKQYVTTSECPVCLYPLVSQPHPQPHPPLEPCPSAFKSLPPGPLEHKPKLSSSKPHPQLQRPRPLSVLSCGHVLHEVCIEAMERFSSTDTLHLCPLCRAPYHRTPL